MSCMSQEHGAPGAQGRRHGKATFSESLEQFVVETERLSSKYWSPMKRVTYIHTLKRPAAPLWDRRGVDVGSFAPDQP
jgi:hypothetical protein